MKLVANIVALIWFVLAMLILYVFEQKDNSLVLGLMCIGISNLWTVGMWIINELGDKQ